MAKSRDSDEVGKKKTTRTKVSRAAKAAASASAVVASPHGDAPARSAGPTRRQVRQIARLARQTAKFPREVTAGLATGGARACWDLDTTGWIDLPGSCFTYSEAGRALLETRAVSTPMVADLYSPPPGARRIFVRKRIMRLVRTGARLHLFHAMHDNVHGFDLHIEIDLETGTVAAADSITSRLPYQGICTEPQGKLASLIGQEADGALRKRIQTQLGGESGCAQLYDLTADLLKLLTF